MRSLLLLIVALAGCTGEQVVSAQPDSSIDAVTADAPASDAIVSDTPPADTPVSDAACPKYSGNLITDGDFATGTGAWRATDCKIERLAGPCGHALRVYDYTVPSMLGADYPGVLLAKGTKLHLRGWFKQGTQTPPNAQPRLFIRSFYATDGGGEASDEYEAFATIGREWQLAERVFTLKNDQTGFQVFIYSYLSEAELSATHDYFVADLSLVAEP